MLGEGAADRTPGAVEEDALIAGRDPEQFADLLRGTAFDIAEADDVLLDDREEGDGIEDEPPRLTFEEEVFGAAAPIGGARLPLVADEGKAVEA